MILVHPQRRIMGVPNVPALDVTTLQDLLRRADLSGERFLELWRMSRECDR